MISPPKMIRCVLSTLLVVLGFICTPANSQVLTPAYGFGVGLGVSSMRGDYIQNKQATAIALGFDFLSERGFFLGRGVGTADNSARSMDFVLGYGTPAVRVGVGILLTEATVPTTDRQSVDIDHPALPFLQGVIVTDTSRPTTLSTTTQPVFLRLVPLHTADTLVVVDGYYGFHTRGNERIPVKVLGLDAEVSTVPQRTGGVWGAGVSYYQRLTQSGVLKIEYQLRVGRMDGVRSTLQGDPFDVYDIKTPDVMFRNQALLVTWVLAR